MTIIINLWWNRYVHCYRFMSIDHNYITHRFYILHLHYTGSLVTGQSYQRYIPWDVNEVNCTGDEATLSNCSVIYPSSNCDTFVGAGVSCYSSKSCVKIHHEPKSYHVPFPLVPNIPTNVEITGVNLNPYSIQVTWSPPDMSNCTDVDEIQNILL